jgi:O-antigen/teichoic acid export membrane protein
MKKWIAPLTAFLEARLGRLETEIARGGIWITVKQSIHVLAAVILNILLARLLSPSELGLYFLVVSLVAVLMTVSQLGLNQSVVRFVSVAEVRGGDGNASAVLVRSLSLCWLATLVLAILGLLFGERILSSLAGEPVGRTLVILMIFWVLLAASQALISDVFRGLARFRETALFGGVVSNVLLVLFLLALVGSETPTRIAGVLWLTILSLLAGVVLGAAQFMLVLRKREGGARSGVRLSHLWSVAWPIWLVGLTQVAMAQGGLWILGYFEVESQVALFGTASRVAALVTMPLLVVNAVISPYVARLLSSGAVIELQSLLRKAATLTTIVAALIVGVFSVGGKILLTRLFGDFYIQGFGILVILSVGFLVNVAAGSAGIVMMMSGHQRTLLLVTLVSYSVVLLGTLISVPLLGAKGLAVSTMMGMLVQNFLAVAAVRRFVGIWTTARLTGPWA